MSDRLFDPGEALSPAPRPAGPPRLRLPRRDQVEVQAVSLDQVLDPEHPARAVWDAVGRLDLGRLLGPIRAVEGSAGRDATAPQLLVALWVYATLQGVGSGRQLAQLCLDHVAYRWLCGGVSVCHKLLSDFRSGQGAALDDLLTQLVAGLMAEGLVTLDQVAQDGMGVRASGGAGSFRRESRLADCLAAARAQMAALKALADADPGALPARQRAARARAAADRQARVERAAAACERLRAQRAARGRADRTPGEERASTTDPDARRMKFADGGYRPGYNVQFWTATGSGVIVGVEVITAGTDGGQLTPMADQVRGRYGSPPVEVLADGGFTALDDIDRLAAAHGARVVAPVKDVATKAAAGKDPYARQPKDTDATAAWRAGMGTAAAQAAYRRRAPTAEWVNALCRNRGLRAFPVRGLDRCQAVAVLYALAHNLAVVLRWAAAAG